MTAYRHCDAHCLPDGTTSVEKVHPNDCEAKIVIPSVRALRRETLRGNHRPNGFRCSFNRILRDDDPTDYWVTPYQFGVDLSPVVLMIDNYRTGMIWD